MAEIIRVFSETLPDALLVGKRYTKKDTDTIGSYLDRWQAFYDNDWFLSVGRLGAVTPEAIGAKREVGRLFEYWTGMLVRPGVEVPEDFECEFIPGGEYAVCWIQGKDDEGGVYNMHDECVEAMLSEGLRIDPAGWFFERYGDRFASPDPDGSIVLDYMARVVSGAGGEPRLDAGG